MSEENQSGHTPSAAPAGRDQTGPADGGAVASPPDAARPAGGAPSGDDGTTAERGDTALPSTMRSLAAPLALLALLIAAAGIAGTGFLWWQYRQFYVALDDADRAQLQTLQTLVREQSDIDGVLDALRQQMTADRDRIVDLRTTIGDFPQQLAALDQRLDALQGRSLDARDVWLRAEAEYYLVVANTEVALSGRVENAITALELADGLLRELGDPALNPVRIAIADELTSLRAVPLIDNEGLAFSLASLATRVSSLPFRAADATRFDAGGPTLDEVEPGLGRLWESLKQAVRGVVRIERRDTPVEVMLSAGERRLVRRQVVLELQLARIALLRGEAEAFRASLLTAEDLLEAEFDTGAAGVAGALELIAELRRLDIAPALPDLSGSLALLRGTAAGGADE